MVPAAANPENSRGSIMEAQNKQGLMVSRAESGQKLLNFLQRRVEAPTGDLHRWIRTGQVRINGKRAKAFDHVVEGNAVRVPPFATFLPAGTPNAFGKPSSDTSSAYRSSLDIVYEDEDILVLAKPAGLPVQGGTGHRDSVAARLARERAHADFVPAPVHRLDKDTTGLLVAGKTYEAIRLLTDALAGRGGKPLRKEYLAWVEGRWPAMKTKELHDFLSRAPQEKRVKVLDSPRDDTREAHCLVTPLEVRQVKGYEYTLLLVRLLTGRTHQIRVQLASRGHPIVGDPWYGEKEYVPASSGSGLKLHAFRLELPLPKKETKVLELLPDWPSPWNVSPGKILSRPPLQKTDSDITPRI